MPCWQRLWGAAVQLLAMGAARLQPSAALLYNIMHVSGGSARKACILMLVRLSRLGYGAANIDHEPRSRQPQAAQCRGARPQRVI